MRASRWPPGEPYQHHHRGQLRAARSFNPDGQTVAITVDDGYRDFQKGSAENVQSSETTLSRFLPELSNAPKEIADASPEFWNPKPAPAMKPKSKPAGTKAGD